MGSLTSFSPETAERLKVQMSTSTSPLVSGNNSTMPSTGNTSNQTTASPNLTTYTSSQQAVPEQLGESSITGPGLGGAITTGSQIRNQAVSSEVLQNMYDPAIPQSAIQSYTSMQQNANEFADPKDPLFQAGGDYAGSVTQAQAQAPTEVDQIGTSTYNASVVGEGAAGTEQAATATTITPESQVQDQMSQLLSGIENGQIPAWAKPAVDQVEAQLAARGLSRSSVGQAALSNAIIMAALPMAQQNAQQSFALQQQNLNNEQQMALANLQVRQESMLSDQAAQNAAKQFNSASENQTAQFMSNLKANVDLTNAARLDAMSQYNSGQANAMSQFNANMQFARDQFNAQNATMIDQSNLQWRRQINQLDTAGINAVNQANAMNAFNLSNQSLTFMWQEMRDQAKWAFEAVQNDEQRKAALAQAALGNEIAQDSNMVNAITQLGAAALNLWNENKK